MWSKGAVVIVKHGDEAMAEALEKGLDIRYRDTTPIEKKCKYELMELRQSRRFKEEIEELDRLYGYNWVPPKWAKGIVEVFALAVYGVSIFIDRYLRIKI